MSEEPRYVAPRNCSWSPRAVGRPANTKE